MIEGNFLTVNVDQANDGLYARSLSLEIAMIKPYCLL